MILGLIPALGSAAATNVAFLFKHRGAVLAPPVRVRHPLRSATDLLRSRWFLVCWLVAVFGFGLHVGALALAPLPIVQAVLISIAKRSLSSRMRQLVLEFSEQPPRC